MSEEKWNDFAEKVDLEIAKDNNMEKEISTEEILNKQWNRIEQAIKKAAADEIPRAKVGPKTFYAFSRKATKLHVALKKINGVLSKVRKGEIGDSSSKQRINEEIQNISKLCQVEIKVKFEELDSEEKIQEKFEILQEYQKIVYKVRNLENE